MPVWTEKDGVYAYNSHGQRWRRGPPQGARLLAFPGTVKPNSHIVRTRTPWVQAELDRYGEVDDGQYRWRRQTRAERRRLAHIAV